MLQPLLIPDKKKGHHDGDHAPDSAHNEGLDWHDGVAEGGDGHEPRQGAGHGFIHTHKLALVAAAVAVEEGGGKWGALVRLGVAADEGVPTSATERAGLS